MNENKQLALAISLAAQGHLNQTDRGGNPYILHPLKVMHYIRSEDPQLMAIAVLHDHQDDCGGSPEIYRSMGFSERVIEGIRLLSNDEGLSYEDYIDRITTNVDAIRVKLADIKHNTDILRLGKLSDKVFEQLQKYHAAHTKLTIALKRK